MPKGFVRVLTDCIEQEIGQDYRAGLSMQGLCQKYAMDFRRIRSVLVRQDISIRQRTNDVVTASRRARILDLYDAGSNVSDIARELGLCDHTIINVARQHGRQIRSKNFGKRRLYPLNEYCFSALSNEAAYWAGMLMADGCISSGNSVSITLHRQDEDHLHTLANFFGSTHHRLVRASDKLATCLGIRSGKIVSDLAQLGIVPRKSHAARAAASMAHNRFFWLGEIDGDGCVLETKEGTPALELCGSQFIVTQFAEFVTEHFGWPPRAISRHKSIFALRINGGQAIEVMKLLWQGHDFGLPRKRREAEALIQRYSHMPVRARTRSGPQFRGVNAVKKSGKPTGRFRAVYRGKGIGNFPTRGQAAAAYVRTAFNANAAGAACKRFSNYIVRA